MTVLTKSCCGWLYVGVIAAVVGICAIPQARAEAVTGTYDFSAPPGDQGPNPVTYGSAPPGGGDITGSAETDPAPLDLFFTPGLGLGICTNPPACTENSNRITPGDFVQLDLIDLKIPPLTSPNLSFRADGLIPALDGSAAEWAVFGSNVAAVDLRTCVVPTAAAAAEGTAGDQQQPACAEILTGSNTDLQDLGPIVGDFRFLDITSLNGGVLLNEIDATYIPTPEPASLALLAAGITGLGLLLHRRRAPTRRPALQ